ncbi:formamidase [Sphaerisporangium krabiense]|uniref:Formamidase n=1 Tax=Sphaerisporangium krabiense TaxID=763782 RepID=A0A7W8Z6F8_9ACTN|nr:formamidase [Sphaerisporangium krabiense]MBB5628271.1 formamidase [Sphaerisporangium krabiense]GII66266.1 formamidase [Sphaerisporangium krabiense]
MPEVVFSVDQTRSMRDQEVPGHNRWHPDIPAVVTVRAGAEFRVECRDWTDAQIGDNDSADDVRDADLTVPHMLSGPVAIEGAEPGDLLIVDILDIGPIPQQSGAVAGQGWGYTGVFARENGGSFLTEHFPGASKAVWDFHGVYATSRHLPGVKFAGITHPGLFGTAPSADLLATWNRRERALIDTDPGRVPPLAWPPQPHGGLAGTASGDAAERVLAEGARTVPPREHGGNQDIKNFSRGARVFCPVFVDGANLSVGDLHYSQGEGEITFCGAIEMGGFIDFHVDLIKGGMEKYGVTTNPVFLPGNVEPRYSEFLSFVGISVDESGTNHYLDATVAYRRACLNAIEYLKKWGYSGEQAYLLLGAAPIEGRISEVVDAPNACCSLYIPTAIFDFDVRPNAEGPVKKDRGRCALTS